MINRLRIKDYILIDALEVEFADGFNVLTGETGAGKSILLGAIRLLCGERPQTDVIRQGATKAIIQGHFTVAAELVSEWLSETAPTENQVDLLLTREINQNGKNICKINGDLCTVGELKRISSLIMAIHGQHDHQQLTHSDQQLLLLDQGLDPDGLEALAQTRSAYFDYQAIQKEIEGLEEDPAAIERALELIAFQCEDIDQAQLQLEDEVLESQLEAMKHAENIIVDLQASRDMIDQSEDQFTIVKTISELMRRMDRYEQYLPEYRLKREWLIDMRYAFQELSEQQRHSMESLVFDPYELIALEKRVNTINHLKRKYGNSIEAILKYRHELDDKALALSEQQSLKSKLLIQLEACKGRYQEWAKILTEKRHASAYTLKHALMVELNQLNFADAQIAIALEHRHQMHASGNEHVEFLVSLNKGMPLAPLKKVASGGEISRVMLAIKAIAAHQDQIDTLIFDEIDTGISGHTASVVADKLYQVSRGRQVICISHLAQVALMADAHFLIEKSMADETTVSRVIPLDFEGSAQEIARIMSGSSNLTTIIENARALKSEAQQKKQLI